MFILIVEDNPAEALLTQEALRETGMNLEICVVTDGEAATEFLRRENNYSDAPRPNLVLLDLNLPRKHGREVLREIKADKQLATIPVIVVSNSRSPEDIADVYRLNGNCYLAKPADIDELFAMMRALVEFWGRNAQLPCATANSDAESPSVHCWNARPPSSPFRKPAQLHAQAR